MKPSNLWRWHLLGAFAALIIFVWLNEIIDLPYLIMGAPKTRINWEEAILESVFIIVVGLISTYWINYLQNKLMQAMQALQVLATKDVLTNAFNRRGFLTKAEEEFVRAQRFEHPFTFALLDFDEFKSVNDNYGHMTGDVVLQIFVKTIYKNIRQHDFVGRLGGDEFAIILLESPPDDAGIICQRIFDKWKMEGILSEQGDKVVTTVSAGISTCQKEDQSLADLIRRADIALYKAKHKGRNRIETIYS